MAKRTKLRDVAEACGVSVATVSYVLNRKPGQSISAETEAKIREKMREMNYVPNLAASFLKSGRSHLIGLILPQLEPGGLMDIQDGFSPRLVTALEMAARVNGYHMIISGTDISGDIESIVRNRGLEGVVILGDVSEKQIEMILDLNRPVICVEPKELDRKGRINLFEMHFEALDDPIRIEPMLLRRGCRDVTLLCTDKETEAAAALGWRVLPGADTMESGHETAMQLDVTNQKAEVGKAVVVMGEKRFLGFMQALAERGVHVPEMMRVVFVGNSSLVGSLYPTIERLQSNMKLAGDTAFDWIVKCREENAAPEKKDAIIPAVWATGRA